MDETPDGPFQLFSNASLKIDFQGSRVAFLVTNLTLPSRAVVGSYNKRGTAEQ